MEPFEVKEFPLDSEIIQMFDCTLIVKVPASFIYKISQTQDVLNVKINGVKFGLTHLKGAAYISEGFTTAMIVFEKPTSILEVVQIHSVLLPLANDVGPFMKRPLLEKVFFASGNDELIQEGMRIIRSKVRNMGQEGGDRDRPTPYSRGPYPQPRAAVRPRPQPELRVPSRANSPSRHPLPTPVPLPMASQHAPRATPFGPTIPPPPPLTYRGTNNVAQKTGLVNTRTGLVRQPPMPRLVPQQRVVPWASQAPSTSTAQDHVWERQWSPMDAYSGESGNVQHEGPNASASRNLTIQNFQIQQNIYESQVARRRDDPPPYEQSLHRGRNDVHPNNQTVNVHNGRGMLDRPSTSYCAPECNEIKYSAQQHFQMLPDHGKKYAIPQAMAIKQEPFFGTDIYKRNSGQNTYSNEYYGGPSNHIGDVENRNGYGTPINHAARVNGLGGGFKRETSDVSYQQGYSTDQSETIAVTPVSNNMYHNWSQNHNRDFGNRNGYVSETRYQATASETVPNGSPHHISYPRGCKFEPDETKPRVSEPPLYKEQREDLSQTQYKFSELVTVEQLDELQKIIDNLTSEIGEEQMPKQAVKSEVLDSDDDSTVISGYWND